MTTTDTDGEEESDSDRPRPQAQRRRDECQFLLSRFQCHFPRVKSLLPCNVDQKNTCIRTLICCGPVVASAEPAPVAGTSLD